MRWPRRWVAPRTGGYSAVPRPGVNYDRRTPPPGPGAVATSPRTIIRPWTDAELWAWYENDPKAHALGQLVRRTVEDR